MIRVKPYDDYQQYIEHQLRKTASEKSQQKEARNFKRNVDRFGGVFDFWLARIAERPERAVCAGARSGAEVKALIDRHIEAVGYDLLESYPLVLYGDMHELPEADGSADFVFSNVLDHSYSPLVFAMELQRICKPGGHILLQLAVGSSDDGHRANDVERLDDVLSLFDAKQLASRPIKWRGSINTEVLLCKS